MNNPKCAWSGPAKNSELLFEWKPITSFVLCGVLPYNMVMKIHISFRLSEDAIRLLKLLAEKKGVSQASIIELAIREMAKKEGVK